MASRLARSAVALALLAAVPGAAASARARDDAPRPSYLPDHVKLQLAGNVGFLSPGLGYAFLGDRVEADLFLGWVPEAIGGEDVVSLTAKLSASPLAVDVGVEWRPVSIGVQATYTFGDQYFVRPPSRFPGDYYDFPTAIRTGITLGSAAHAKVGAIPVGAYVELVALDLMLKAWAESPRTVGPRDVFSLAVGLRAGL